jgi:ubiquinone/menaquinone biosynthesis C-methylase UbiE
LGEFERVVGIDVSPEQIKQAKASDANTTNVSYVVSQAEDLPIDSGTVDLVTCSQAYHWFNWNQFHQEVKRVLRSPGCLAVYGYGLPQPHNEHAKHLMSELYGRTLKGYWDERRQYVDNCYKDFVLPFKRFERVDSISTTIHTNIGHFVGYVSTWSGYIAYRKHHPNLADPLIQFRERLIDLVAHRDYENPLETPMVAVAPLFLLLGVN